MIGGIFLPHSVHSPRAARNDLANFEARIFNRFDDGRIIVEISRACDDDLHGLRSSFFASSSLFNFFGIRRRAKALALLTSSSAMTARRAVSSFVHRSDWPTALF